GKDGTQLFCAEHDVYIKTNHGYESVIHTNKASQELALIGYYGNKFAKEFKGTKQLEHLLYSEMVVQYHMSQNRVNKDRNIISESVTDPTGKDRVSTDRYKAFKKKVEHASKAGLNYPSFKSSDNQKLITGETLTLTNEHDYLKYY